jgi:hypothetical protein
MTRGLTGVDVVTSGNITAMINEGMAGAGADDINEARERFEEAFTRAVGDASQADRSIELLGGASWHHLLISPTDSVFARWLLSEGLAFTSGDGDVVLPYQGSHLQAATLAHMLIIRVREVVSAVVTSGEEPPASYYETFARIHGTRTSG